MSKFGRLDLCVNYMCIRSWAISKLESIQKRSYQYGEVPCPNVSGNWSYLLWRHKALGKGEEEGVDQDIFRYLKSDQQKRDSTHSLDPRA